MPKEQKEMEKPKSRLRHKVVNYGDYLIDARKLLESGPVDGMTEPFDVAVALVYERHKVIGIIQKSGETRYVVET